MGARILVVDDEKEIADLVEVYLKNENFEVCKYHSAKEALRCIEEAALDLAILDVMLPSIRLVVRPFAFTLKPASKA